jgi:Holliday junction resolvase RusA-like endonuclease
MTAPTTISFFVAGEPVPKGSTKSFAFRRNNGKLGVATTNANPKTEGWELRVASEAQKIGQTKFFTEPVGVGMQFLLTRPKSVSVKNRPYPTKKFDLDKLQRAVLDGLTGTLIEDDGLVVKILDGTRKDYAQLGQQPGCYITITNEVSP